MLDYLVIAADIIVLTVAVQIVLRTVLSPSITRFLSNPTRADLFAFLALVLPVILCFALSESGSRQATWGKRRVSLRVEDESGQRLSRPRSLLRSVAKFLPWQIAHTSLFHIPGWPVNVTTVPVSSLVGFIDVWILVLAYLGFPLFHPSRRAPYDFIPGSRVVGPPAGATPTARPS